MRSIFKNQNETDTMAALKVWAQTLAEQRGIRIDPEMRVYSLRSEAENALRDKEVDALTLMLDEYTGISRDLLDGPFFRHEVNGRIHEEFVILSREDQGVSTLADLRGAKLGIHDNRYVGMASAWLDAQLADSGLPAVTELFGSVDYDTKLSAVVLGVFFGKHDAALVSRSGFLSVAELNPQVAKQLRVVKAASPIVPTFFCFRTDLPSALKNRFLGEVLRLHESIVGAQVLRVFKSDRMAELTNDQVERSLALLDGWTATAAESRNATRRTQWVE